MVIARWEVNVVEDEAEGVVENIVADVDNDAKGNDKGNDKANDNDNDFYMDLNIDNVIPYYVETGQWIDPIDTLQTQFDLWYEEEFPYSLGDINQDGIYNVLDVVSLVAIIMGSLDPSNLEEVLADLNQDGEIDVLDVVTLVNLVLS